MKCGPGISDKFIPTKTYDLRCCVSKRIKLGEQSHINNMKKIAKIAVLALGALVSQAAHAQNSPGSLMLGFSDNDASPTTFNDYIINLGTASSLIADAGGVGGTVDLSSDFSASAFNAAFAGDSSALSDVNVGIVGGDIEASGKSLYLSVFGGSGAPPAIAGGTINSAGNTAEAIGAGTLLSSSSQSFTYLVAVDPNTSGNFAGHNITDETGINPLNTLSAGVLSEDLYVNSRANGGTGAATGWTQVGTFNFNLNNTGSGVVTFTSDVVPEPGACALMGGAGLLALLFRRNLSRKNA